MTFLRLYRRIGAWLAMVALLAGALSPVVAQAVVAGADRSDWIEVCGVSGMMWVKADTGEVSNGLPDEDGQPVSDVTSSCPWCVMHAGGNGLVPAQWPAFVLSARLTGLPPALPAAPALSVVWAPAHSRAPPPTA
ncbi:MAG: DUF2946 family protein [Gammaproteobacteria bacterium]